MNQILSSGRFLNATLLEKNDFGVLESAFDRKSAEPVLLRRIKRETFESSAHITEFRNAVEALAKSAPAGSLVVRQVAVTSSQIVVLIDGAETGSLKDRMQDATFAPLPLLQELRVLAHNLDLLHAQGQIHGDLRPESIFVGPADSLLFNEFAVHHALCGWTGGNLEFPREFIGPLFKPEYVAPELWTGGTATPFADQYALGVVLVECVTGLRTAVSGQAAGVAAVAPGPHSPAAIQMLLSDPRVSKERSVLIDPLRPILKRMLSADPRQRFPTCEAALNEALRAIKSLHKHARRKLQWVAAAVGLSLLIGGAVYAWLSYSEQQKDSLVARRKQQLAAAITRKYSANLPKIDDVPLLAALSDLDPASTSFVDSHLKSIQDRRRAHSQDRNDRGESERQKAAGAKTDQTPNLPAAASTEEERQRMAAEARARNQQLVEQRMREQQEAEAEKMLQLEKRLFSKQAKRRHLEELIHRYPKTAAATKARDMLQEL